MPPKGGHPFKAGTQHTGGKPRTLKVRQASRRNAVKAHTTRYLGARGETHERRP